MMKAPSSPGPFTCNGRSFGNTVAQNARSFSGASLAHATRRAVPPSSAAACSIIDFAAAVVLFTLPFGLPARFGVFPFFILSAICLMPCACAVALCAICMEKGGCYTALMMSFVVVIDAGIGALTCGCGRRVFACRVVPVENALAVFRHDRGELGDVAGRGGCTGWCVCECGECDCCDGRGSGQNDFIGGLLAFAPCPDAGKLIMPDFAGGGKLRGLREELCGLSSQTRASDDRRQ